MSQPIALVDRTGVAHDSLIRKRENQIHSISVLMSTYAGEIAENLKACLESLYCQTLPPDQLVLVVDGPVGDDQEQVIAAFREDRRIPIVTVLRTARSQGLAAAMNLGLKECSGTLTMRMDSDDLCEPDRIEHQLAYVESHPDIDIVSSWSEEFFTDGTPAQLKVSPVGHDAVVRALRWRNVLVHPTILIKTEWLRRLGGYRVKYGRLEDYDLFVRLVLAGAKFHVIPKVLVRVRSSTEQRTRRGGLGYFWNDVTFRLYCLRSGFLNLREFIVVTGMYAMFRLISGPLRRRFYALARV
ncbi:glycosyltransferase [Microvirga sp. 2TAF3]|uniref:glycosyltransferase n=1 Tax=Microvirga sp. 2TAF3 TaxID=3233014 RepID=UPI003F97FFC8